jgi:tetratricopeptide (TPR) repeat protein
MKRLHEALGFAPAHPDDPLDLAQEIIYEAWEAPTAARRVALARKALETSADCADAYVILAQRGKTLEEQIDLFRQGVAAGERALGPEEFEEHSGYLWGLLETRPYMRARLGLAVALWQLGEREETLSHFRDLLRLNPNDNQGVRELLLASLLVMGRDQEAQELLDRPEYEDTMLASWAYSRVLLAFRREGASEDARLLLASALEMNGHVPSYLLGRKPLPKRSLDHIGYGDESEAIAYAEEFLQAWQATPGALRWLAGEVAAR